MHIPQRERHSAQSLIIKRTVLLLGDECSPYWSVSWMRLASRWYDYGNGVGSNRLLIKCGMGRLEITVIIYPLDDVKALPVAAICCKSSDHAMDGPHGALHLPRSTSSLERTLDIHIVNKGCAAIGRWRAQGALYMNINHSKRVTHSLGLCGAIQEKINIYRLVHLHNVGQEFLSLTTL